MKIYTKKYLNELREKINIVEIISLWVPLRKSGDVYKACCPFHDEPTPSFTVHTKTNHYHCLGCGAHGDSVAFLMNYLQCGFKEAIRCIEVFYKKKRKEGMYG